MEKSDEPKDTEKKLACFFCTKKPSTFEFRKKTDSLKFIEFVEQFMMALFLLKLTQFEKTGSIGKTFR